MASLESLERTLTRLRRHDMTVLEHEPAKGLVAAQDILRTLDGQLRSRNGDAEKRRGCDQSLE